MKKLTLALATAFMALLFASCGKPDYNDLVGTWGVEKIEYYNIDYQGNPIPGSYETYSYDPNSTDNGIQLIFREDYTGETRDSAIDTIWVNYNAETQQYETPIPCSDTVLVQTFTCSYDKDNQYLYMNLDGDPRPYKMSIHEFSDDSFVYENEYHTDYVEKAHLKRLSKTPTKDASKASSKPVKHPHHRPGSLFGNR